MPCCCDKRGAYALHAASVAGRLHVIAEEPWLVFLLHLRMLKGTCAQAGCNCSSVLLSACGQLIIVCWTCAVFLQFEGVVHCQESRAYGCRGPDIPILQALLRPKLG